MIEIQVVRESAKVMCTLVIERLVNEWISFPFLVQNTSSGEKLPFIDI
jgi:hypothetical protein